MGPWASLFWKGLFALGIPPYPGQKQVFCGVNAESTGHCDEKGQLGACTRVWALQVRFQMPAHPGSNEITKPIGRRHMAQTPCIQMA